MTEKIREQILAVRKTGRTNMFDIPMVQYIANEMRFYELVIFLEEHRSEYVHFILTGVALKAVIYTLFCPKDCVVYISEMTGYIPLMTVIYTHNKTNGGTPP